MEWTTLEQVMVRSYEGKRVPLRSYLEENLFTPLLREQLDLWLEELEKFFQAIGGIQGLKETMDTLLGQEKLLIPDTLEYVPHKISISESNFQAGILHQKDLLEIIVLGGAAERLQFVDERTEEPLPAFLYPFMGKPLLRWLIEEIEAKEERYFLLTGEKIVTPIVFMTSSSKNNCVHLERYLVQQNWFSRPSESFCFLKQPLVPNVDREGNWLVEPSGVIEKNPCGHGALWFLLEKEAVFSKPGFEKSYGLVRQINNPLVSHFGSTSCFMATAMETKSPFAILVTEPLEGTKEGRVVRLVNGNTTNIEYTNALWEKAHGFANVNVLLFSWEKIRPTLLKNPYPGCLLNFKEGEKARLEMSMQNLMDALPDVAVCYLQREYAIKAIKRSGVGVETRLSAFQQFQKLYQQHMPGIIGSVFYIHSFLSEKLDWWQKSSATNSFVSLNVYSVKMCGVNIQGAFVVESSTPHAKLQLENVEICNQGIDEEKSDLALGQIVYQECFRIVFQGSGKCVLKNMRIMQGATLKISAGESLEILGAGF